MPLAAFIRGRDRLLRVALSSLDYLGGGYSGRLRAICRYGLDRIDSGGASEFYALLRHRVRRLLRFDRRRRRSWRPIAIDARCQRLTLDGRLVPKPTMTWAQHGAEVLVSVVIPCYNYGQYLDDAIDSVRAQTVAALDIVIVDDGSTDAATCAVVERLSADATVRVIRQENLGLPAARNRGIAEAHGEYVCCLDADDLLEPTYLEQAIAVMELDRAVGFAYSWVQRFGDDNAVWPTRDFEADAALIGNFTSVAAVFRRDDWQTIGGFSVAMQGGFEDWEFWIRLSALGRIGRCIPYPLFKHRVHGITMTTTAKAMAPELRRRMREAFPEFYKRPALRRRLGRLVAPPQPVGDAFARPGAIVTRSRPGLLVVVAGLRYGGAHTLLLDILTGLQSKWQIVVLTTGRGTHGLESAFRSLTADVFHLNGFLPQTSWQSFAEHLIASRRIEAVLSSDCLWWLQQVTAVRDRHPAITLFDLTHNHVPTSTFRATIAHSGALDAHIAVSSHVAAALRDAGVPGTRIATIANGVDPAHFHAAAADRRAARRTLGLIERASADTPHTRLLIWIGRMSDEKRPEAFLDLLAALAGTGHVKGLMVGGGALAPAIDEAITARGLTSIVSRRPHLPRELLPSIYAAADFLVLTSRIEGMPLVVLESLASGCPVATTNVGDVGRIVQHGYNGFIVEPDEVPLIAGVLQRAFQDDSQLLALREHAAESFRQSPFQLSQMQAAYTTLFSEARARRRIRR